MDSSSMKSIKYLILTLVLALVATTTYSQDKIERQTVYSLIKQKQTVEWYKAQAELWKEYLDKNPKDGEGWISYYTANRMLKIYGAGVKQHDLDNIENELVKKHIPNTFEYHYIAVWNLGLRDIERSDFHLKKAQELGPDRVEFFDDLTNYYEIRRDKKNSEVIAKKWFASNDISPGVYAWNYNMLQSVEDNAILLTVGDNDTYPAWILQRAKGIKPNVSVVNLGLIRLEDYRKTYFKELGIPYIEIDWDKNPSYEATQTMMTKHIRENTDRPVYLGISASQNVYESFKDEVYNVGLAYKCSEQKFDNIAVIKKNYEKHYMLDYLKADFSNDISQGIIDDASSNYLVPFITLYNHYVESDDPMGNGLRRLIDNIANRSGSKAEVDQILDGDKRRPTAMQIDPKTLEKGLVEISDSMYAYNTEVTNAMYELFLTDLLKQKRYDELQEVKAEAVNWSELSKNNDSKDIYKNGHPDDPLCPVVNVSYESALAYCKWLTETYNALDSKRKKYNNVSFRLPTESEWEYLAASGKEGQKYSWGGPYCRNAKGCFLANLKSSCDNPKPEGSDKNEDCDGGSIDGAVFTVRGDSYFANDFGLYGMIGNASEMVYENGICKGGSWNTTPDNATITSKESYTSASPQLGFRVIMVVE